MQRVFRVVDTAELKPVGVKSTDKFNRSVRRYGIVSPILVAEVPDEDGVIGLSIIDGNRRVRAAKSAGLPKVPAVVLKATSAKDRARLTLICNYMRSTNFHTESTAILALADGDDAAAQAARVMGLGPAKMQQLYRKIATMPDAVRQAMYEHRIPVTAASWVGSWPDDLQREVVELLEHRRYVRGTTLKALRASYELQHPGAFQPEGDVATNDEWGDDDLIATDVPMPALSPVGVAAPTAEPAVPVDSTMPRTTATAGVSPTVVSMPPPVMPAQSAPTITEVDRPADPPLQWRDEPAPVDERAAIALVSVAEGRHVLPGTSGASFASDVPARQDLHDSPRSAKVTERLSQPAELPSSMSPRVSEGLAFVIRLDAALAELAGEAQERGISREVWVDRTMRAWDRAGAS